MTILAIAQTCAKRLQLTSPSSFIGSTDNNMILLLAMLERTVQEVRDEYPWPELQKEYTFTLATSTASYILPSDLNSIMMETLWNRTEAWPLIGPLDANQWQTYKSGLITSLPRQRFRVKGWTDKQFFIDPTPSSSENGQTCVYEYISKTAIRPKTWVASTSWAGISYCSYNGNIYSKSSGTTTGTTAPTHTSGSVSDGGITWAYVSAAYETFQHDSDEIILDNRVIIDGAIWRFKQERGLDFEDLRAQAEAQKDLAKTKLSPTGIISLTRSDGSPNMIGLRNYPEADYGS